MNRYVSWGRYPRASHRVLRQAWRNSPLPLPEDRAESVLPFGNGRSYGDVCLNDGAALIDARPLDHFIAFDAQTGVLRCEAGVLLEEILSLVMPRGWFLAVTPGTRFITVGGAIANDVHGKNHHRLGTFGRHVRQFELLRSDASRLLCSPTSEPQMFAATIGGLGLTGLITWAEIQLRPIEGPFIESESLCFNRLDEFFELSEESDRSFEYTAAWIDCVATGSGIGRGVYFRGNHSTTHAPHSAYPPRARFRIPLDPPMSLLNGVTLKAFNGAYRIRHSRNKSAARVHFASFFYPLDSIREWNRIYGPAGFLQYQCILPRPDARESLRELLQRIASAGTGSFLAVLKVFGAHESPGIMSFPAAGVTLALDFPNRGANTLNLLDQLDNVVRQAQGRIYPAKDARMSAADFQRGYPRWREVEALRDPRFDSSFWRRVRGEQP